MKQTIFGLLALLLAITKTAAVEPYYTAYTNLYSTNTISGLSTNTYSGTNYLDMTRYRHAQVAATFSSDPGVSNWAGLSFIGSPDATNWDTATIYVVMVQAQGTNRAIGQGTFDWSTIGFIKPYQTWNTNAQAFTNFSVLTWTKTVPRN
jgi:hypothetical protein